MENPSPTGTLQRNGPEPRKDDFWEALSSNYNYLMNDELIASCRVRTLSPSFLHPPLSTILLVFKVKAMQCMRGKK